MLLLHFNYIRPYVIFTNVKEIIDQLSMYRDMLNVIRHEIIQMYCCLSYFVINNLQVTDLILLNLLSSQ